MVQNQNRKKRILGIFGILLSILLLIGSVGALFSVFRNKDNEEDLPYSSSVSTVFAENSWKTIAKVFKAGVADRYWNLGDTKEIELSDGYTYEVQIVDMTPNRYALSDGTGYSNGVLQFVQCLSTTYQMNSSATNAGGYAECSGRVELNTTIYNQLPNDLKAVIPEVSVASGIGGGTTSGISESNNKLFIPSEYEIFGERTLSIGDSEGSPQFGYYSLPNSTRIKTKVGSDSSAHWWLRSPYSGYSAHFCAVRGENGNVSGLQADYTSISVCPCFAF